MNCIIVGGAGFIGSHISEKLFSENHKISVFDQPSAKNISMLKQIGIPVITGSFLDELALRNALSGQDVLIHLVSTTTPVTSNIDPLMDVKNNMLGTLQLLSIAKECGVKKIIFSSSGGTVYGLPETTPINEDHPTNPICSYGVVKLAIEKYLHLFWRLYGLDYIILRISNAYGERQSTVGNQGIIPTIIQNGLMNKEIVIRGDGESIRDYIYAKDIANAFAKATDYAGSEKVFNIGYGNGVSINQIIAIINEKFPLRLKIRYTPANISDVPVNILDNSKAIRELCWKPDTEFSDGLRNTVTWFSSIISN